jgi:hypothetical protein
MFRAGCRLLPDVAATAECVVDLLMRESAFLATLLEHSIFPDCHEVQMPSHPISRNRTLLDVSRIGRLKNTFPPQDSH